jgi:hypothetical protein
MILKTAVVRAMAKKKTTLSRPPIEQSKTGSERKEKHREMLVIDSPAWRHVFAD